MSARRIATPWLALAFVALGCGDSLSRIGYYRFGDDVQQGSANPQLAVSSPAADAGPSPGAGAPAIDAEAEELAMEDQGALDALIAEKLAQPAAAPSVPAPAPAGPVVSAAPGAQAALSAHESFALGPEACLEKLRAAGVSFHAPGFETPLVETPLLLDGPVNGVVIRPKWPGGRPEHAVVDCHLALALLELARQAKALGVAEILFYSTYRPAKSEAERSRLARNRKASQHRRARAIDVRWLVLDDGRTIDVLEHFHRRSGEPPCDDAPEAEEARILQALACGLHEARTFNVILTPNANRAHHNHLHLDVTPDAAWYIIR